MTSADGKPPGYNSSTSDGEKTPAESVYYNFPDGNQEYHPAGTRERIAALEAELTGLDFWPDEALSEKVSLIKTLEAARDNERRRADEATHQWGVIEVLLGAVEEERDELRAEVARLRDRVQAFAEAAHMLVIRFTCSDLDRGVYADALNCLAAAMTDQEIGGDFSRPDAAVSGDPARFMPLPFTDDTTVSKHAPDVTYELSGLCPLPLSVERIVNDTEHAQAEQD